MALSSKDFVLTRAPDDVGVTLGRYAYDAQSIVYVSVPDDTGNRDLHVGEINVKRLRELAAWATDFADRSEHDARRVGQK